MKVTLKVDPDRMTIDDFITIEEGSKRTKAARDLLAKCVVDPSTGEFLPENEAKAVIGKLTLTEMLQVGAALGKQVQEMMAAMVPTKTASE